MSNTAYTEISGKDVEATVNKMLAVTEGLTPSLVYMSCIALALMTQDPNIGGSRLKEGILEASKWFMDYLDGDVEEPETPPEKMN